MSTKPSRNTQLTIVGISDTHGRYPEKVPDGDVLIHAGDITLRGELELLRGFNEWLGTMPHARKLVIAGNHDFCFEQNPTLARSMLTNAMYLQDSLIEIDGVRFYGAPWSPKYGSWAFQQERGSAMATKWQKIPEQTDVLITHAPPYGYRDLLRPEKGGYEVGCRDLLRRIEQIKPKLHICGHIHEMHGFATNGDTVIMNACIAQIPFAQGLNEPLVYNLIIED